MRSVKAEKMRELFAGPDLVRIAGAHNGMSAKLVEAAGFEGIWASGLEISASHAVPDANILSMTQFLDAAIAMNDVTEIPVIADCDTGYGNANNVIHAVQKYEAAGIAGICIEDKLFPKVNSFVPGRQELATVGEFVGKILAGKNAQRTREFMLIARTEALIAGWGMDEAFLRARAYAEAGADAVLIHSKLKTADEIRAFAERWDMDTPLVCVPTTYNTVRESELRELGYKMVIYANHGLRAAFRGMRDVLAKLSKAGRAAEVEPDIVPMSEIFEMQGMHVLKEREKKYSGGRETARVVIPAAGRHAHEEKLKNVLREFPLTMLDINGKPLLQRNVETLNQVGIQDITVVVGYQKDRVNVDGIKRVDNPNFEKTHVLDSIMRASDALRGRTLVMFSDILVERELISGLLQCPHDIALVVDASFRRTPERKAHDLVIAEHAPDSGPRVLSSSRKTNPVKRIGKKIDQKAAHYEFVGIAYFSNSGIETFKHAVEQARAEFNGKAFYEAESFSRASFSDILQYIIDRAGATVHTYEVGSGWAEIHTFEDYKRICSVLAHA